LIVAAPAVAHAQADQTYEGGFDPEQYEASADPRSIALQDSARPLARGDYSAGLVLHLAGPPLDVCVRDAETPEGECAIGGDIINSRLRADLVGIYGLGRFDFRVVLPVVLYQSSDFDPAMGQDGLGSAGIGDLRFGGRVGLLEKQGAALAFDLSLSLPTGGGENFIGDSGVMVDPRLIGEWRRDRLALGASFGYRFRQDSGEIANLYVDDELLWSLGGEYAIQPDKLTAGLSLFGRVGVKSNPDPMMGVSGALGGEERPAELMASARYFLSDQLSLEAGAGTAVSSGYGAAPFRVLAGVRWMDVTKPTERGPLVRDRDGDGIVDGDDKCVATAEDVDDWEDSDGCPELDNDEDRIPDASDKCPLVAEDRDGVEDEDGCPDGDNDADGIADNADKCPAEAEDVDGFQDEDGCPDGDNDADGIADATDQCPMEAETVNGQTDEDGCPERAVATVTSTGIEISDKIFFDLNRASIKDESNAILDVVAEVLKTNADLTVRIEGHTDDSGGATWNRELSQKRAESVRDYLVAKGVDAARLEAVGHGEDKPLVEGKSDEARSKNRRVEFVIVDRASP
jgi:outer membrane protein OmpA-like peptidoglycan-associated protein